MISLSCMGGIINNLRSNVIIGFDWVIDIKCHVQSHLKVS